MKMGKIDLLSLSHVLAERHGMKKKDAQAFVKELVGVLNDGLRTDRQVKIKELGTFKITSVSARKSVNVSTGESIVLDGRDKISFTPDKSMADLVNRPFGQFETTVLADDVDFSEVNEKYNFVEDENLESEEQFVGPSEEADAVNVLKEEPKVEHLVESPVAEETVSLKEPVSTAPAEATPVIMSALTEAVEFPDVPVESPSPIVEQPAAAPQESVPVASEEEPPVDTAQPVEESPQEDAAAVTEVPTEVAHSRRRLPWWLWLLLFLLVLIVAGFLYWTRMSKKAAESNDAVVKPAVEQPVQPNQPTEEELIASYNEHPLVQTGAWRIEGIKETVKVLPGQTFKGICKAHLGEGMECYVEAVNDGKTSVSAGDEVKIPKLITKKAWKKLQQQNNQ